MRDVFTDEFRLIACPIGFKLLNDTGHDNLACVQCPTDYYVQDSRDPHDQCRPCPSSARCVNGGPPLFESATVTGKIELDGLPDDAGEDVVRQALADLLGIDVSQIELPPQDRRQRRTRMIVFQIVGDPSQIASLSDHLQTGDLASHLSSQLSNDLNISITAEVSGGEIEADSEARPVGEKWEEVQGEYLLRGNFTRFPQLSEILFSFWNR